MTAPLPLWIEWSVTLLLGLSGGFALAAAVGLLRFKTFFMRMHPPALAFSLAAWCLALASGLYFSWLDQHLSLRAGLIVVLLALTVPVTTTLLARTELFRRRSQPLTADTVPPPLSPLVAPDEPAAVAGVAAAGAADAPPARA